MAFPHRDAWQDSRLEEEPSQRRRDGDRAVPGAGRGADSVATHAVPADAVDGLRHACAPLRVCPRVARPNRSSATRAIDNSLDGSFLHW